MLVCLSGLVMVICAGVFVEHLFSRGRSFASYQDQIAVIESHTSHRTSGSNLLVTVVGVITNRSEFGWKEVILEAQMFDEHGALIDVVTHSGAYAGVTIAPHGEAGFKIESKAAHQESRYAAHHVSVRWAKDINEWP